MIIDFSNLNQKQSKININTHQKKIGGRKNTWKTKRKKVAINTDKLKAKSKQQTNEQTTSATTIKHRIKYIGILEIQGGKWEVVLGRDKFRIKSNSQRKCKLIALYLVEILF